MTIAEELSNLFLPSRCEICQRLPKPICDDCWSRIIFAPREIHKAGLTGQSITDYRDVVADLLNAFKDRHQRKLGERLADRVPTLLERPKADLLVFAPSSARNLAARGYVPAEVIANRLARAWRLPVMSLRLATTAHHQSELDRNQRLSNLVGAMSAGRPLIGRRVVLVDDIVTTGATLAEMARAVEQAGGVVAGFITVAETIPKSHTNFAKRV